MARADLLLSLVKAGASGDRGTFQMAAEALIAEERAKRHDVLADRLKEVLHRNGGNGSVSESNRRLVLSTGQVHDLLLELTPRRDLGDLVLSEHVITVCRELIEEHHRSDLLRSHNLEPRHRVLLTGPPGNGKTSLAEALATALMVPLIVARYEGLIGSYLGETASRLKRLFEYVRTRGCVLFFDEFDTLGKERGDIHDTGEIKRVVSSLLLQIDELPAHVVVVTATNHPELLDRAVWRRFQVRLEMSPPSCKQVVEFIDRAQRRLNADFGLSSRSLADKLLGSSYSELEDFVTDIVRQKVLQEPGANIRSIIKSRLEQRRRRFAKA